MSVQALLEELAALGIELRADGADLEYEGPKEAITPELIYYLKQYKAELIASLIQNVSSDRPATHTADIASIETRGSLDAAGRMLKSAGWKPKERRGKTIWENPATGFYCSQDAALEFLDRMQDTTEGYHGVARNGRSTMEGPERHQLSIDFDEKGSR